MTHDSPGVDGHDGPELAYANDYFRVMREGGQHWVEQVAPKGVILAIRDGLGNFLVVTKPRAAFHGEMFPEFPRGRSLPGEDAHDTAARLLALLGIPRIALSLSAHAGWVHADTGLVRDHITVVVVDLDPRLPRWSGVGRHLSPTSSLWFPRDALIELTQCGLTLAALLKSESHPVQTLLEVFDKSDAEHRHDPTPALTREYKLDKHRCYPLWQVFAASSPDKAWDDLVKITEELDCDRCALDGGPEICDDDLAPALEEWLSRTDRSIFFGVRDD